MSVRCFRLEGRTTMLWMCTLAVLAVAGGCRKKAKKAAPKLEVTAEATEVEERNLRALCAAAAEVRKQPGVQDRLARIAEIAAPTSATTEMLDGLIALEGPKRLDVLKKLVEKYGIAKECKEGLPAFEVAAEAPAPNAPTPPTDPNASAGVAAPTPVPAEDMGVRGAAPVLAPGQAAPEFKSPAPEPAAPAKAAFGGFRGLEVPTVTAGRVQEDPAPPAPSTAVVAVASRTGGPMLALPAGRAPTAPSAVKAPTVGPSEGGLRGMALPGAERSVASAASPASAVSPSSMGTTGGLRGMAAPVPPGQVKPVVVAQPMTGTPPANPAGDGPKFAPGGTRDDGKAPRFAPGGTRDD